MSEDTRRLLGDINRRLGRVERNGVHYRVNDDGDPTLVWQGGSVGFDGSSTSSGVGTGWFNVKSYGAVGDGTTDDRAAIQLAMDAADAADGGTVYFPPCAAGYGVEMGDYQTITVPNNTTVLGSGYAGRLVRIGAFLPDTYSWLFTNEVSDGTGENIAFKDLWIEGNFAAEVGYDHGASYRYAAIRIEEYHPQFFRNLRIEGCTVIDFPGAAFHMSQVEEFLIADNMTKNTVRESVGGFNACAHGVIADNEFRNHLDDAIALRGDQGDNDNIASHIVISGNQTTNEDAAAFGLSIGGNNGIAVAATEDVVITGNKVDNADNSGIKLCEMNSKMTKRAVVTGNEVKNCESYGIFVGAGVSGGDDGEGVASGSNYVISGNIVTGCTLDGIRVEPVSSTAELTDVTVANNDVQENGGSASHGIAFQGSSFTGGGGTLRRVVCTGNRVRRPAAAGINVQDTVVVEDLLISGNQITEPAYVTSLNNGINLAGTISDFLVSGNHISDNSGSARAPYGINIGTGCTDGVLEGNLAINSHFAGSAGLSNSAGITVQIHGNKTRASVATIASAATITLSADAGLVYDVTGTTNITSVTASWPGRTVTLRFAGALTFTDGSNLKLNGNFVTAADDTITLVCDGSYWTEMSRSSGSGGAPSGAAGGALDGSYPNPGLAAAVAGAGLTESSDVLAIGEGHGIDVSANDIAVDETELTGIADAALASPNNVAFKAIMEAASVMPAGLVAGNYLLGNTDNTGPTVSGTGADRGAMVRYIDPADYAVAGLTTKVRVRGTLFTNGTAPTANFNFELFPVSAVGGGAGLNTITVGTAVSGINIQFATPAANTRFQGVSSEVTAPSADYYVLVCRTNATLAANSRVVVSAQLQVRNT